MPGSCVNHSSFDRKLEGCSGNNHGNCELYRYFVWGWAAAMHACSMEFSVLFKCHFIGGRSCILHSFLGGFQHVVH